MPYKLQTRVVYKNQQYIIHNLLDKKDCPFVIISCVFQCLYVPQKIVSEHSILQDCNTVQSYISLHNSDVYQVDFERV